MPKAWNSATYSGSVAFNRNEEPFPLNIQTAGKYAVNLTCLLPVSSQGLSINGATD
jgi:hypothetical protein